MSTRYGFGKQVDVPFEQALERVTAELQKEGFGVLTEINVAATLKKKLDDATEFPKEEQQRFAATATAMGLSYGQARELLEIVVKKNAPVGRRSRDG